MYRAGNDLSQDQSSKSPRASICCLEEHLIIVVVVVVVAFVFSILRLFPLPTPYYRPRRIPRPDNHILISLQPD